MSRINIVCPDRSCLKRRHDAQAFRAGRTYQAARAVFEERELVDLTVAISVMNAYNRMAISFRTTPQAVIQMAASPETSKMQS
jgi:hypothetical protein